MILREIEFGSDEYQLACQLREAVLRRPLGLRLGKDDLRGEEEQLHFGMFADDELVACVIAVPLSAEEAKIRQTAVVPRYQRQGLATTMMRELEAILCSRGYSTVSLHARRSAVAFYQKLGYVGIGEELIEVTIPHLKMVKKLV